ncbi:P-loop containing nucleoside triphosphate hydrolase protein [Sparassis latifolia]|uniref:P-loop containing nucleoside triphosphate hydrolase protein n=1 Tax=Sparassis crispa TaxID=139825 RepID=A0A401H5W1_9APHY|nr:P-loop containing nucleoside triphosphate hydrolase protein [Sparassis crispa]GBE89825.1 P-loop containing nucleoside triphosphate hydrolase protein [Sparassis crispa]
MDPQLSQVHSSTGHNDILRARRVAQAASYGLALPPFMNPVAGELVEYTPLPKEGADEDEDAPRAAPGTLLEVKYLHEELDQFRTKYVLKPAPSTAQEEPGEQGASARYAAYAFTVIRRFSPSSDGQGNMFNVTTTFQINSKPLIEVCQEVIGQGQGVSWTAKPLRIDPQLLLSFLRELQECAAKLVDAVDAAEREKYAHLQHLLQYLTTTHSSTISTLSSLLAHGEITFDLLWALYVPRKTILCTTCPVTGEPRTARLVHAELCQQLDVQAHPFLPVHHSLGGSAGSKKQEQQLLWRLTMEYVEADVGLAGARTNEMGSGAGPRVDGEEPAARFGLGMLNAALEVHAFKGTRKISSLSAYPIQYYTGVGGENGLRERLIARGRKWAAIAGGMRHVAYRGLAFRFKQVAYIKTSVNSRIIVDRKTFQDIVPNYGKFPIVTKTISGNDLDRFALVAGAVTESLSEASELSEEDLMLASPIVYGFSLSDKQWLEFAVDNVRDLEWNDDAFNHLVIPAEQKMVLKTLVESHNTGAAAKFDDFVSGKGLGLVINLFGNPGTGKSLTAEGISEYLRKPLYVVGAAELGTTAEVMDANLATVLRAAAAWGAVVLIDEADVFLEERSLHFLERNAMVAVFLRQLEYFRGILFLTTNRVRVFDEAFQSRIHVSLRYHDLSPDARKHIWVAFMQRVNGNIPDGGLTREELRELGEKKVNGRQIKNVVKTAGALAIGRQEKFGYRHLSQVLGLMEQFDFSHAMYQ